MESLKNCDEACLLVRTVWHATNALELYLARLRKGVPLPQSFASWTVDRTVTAYTQGDEVFGTIAAAMATKVSMVNL